MAFGLRIRTRFRRSTKMKFAMCEYMSFLCVLCVPVFSFFVQCTSDHILVCLLHHYAQFDVIKFPEFWCLARKIRCTSLDCAACAWLPGTGVGLKSLGVLADTTAWWKKESGQKPQNPKPQGCGAAQKQHKKGKEVSPHSVVAKHL